MHKHTFVYLRMSYYFTALNMRNYKRTTTRQSWSEESMRGAIQEVLSNNMGYKRAAQAYNVPQSTLEDRVKKARLNNLSPSEAATKGLGRYKTVFSEQQEKELVKYILELEERLFGITLKELRELAYELAEQNKIPHTFNRQKKLAGKDWMYGFLERHQEISLRNPEKTSLARAKGFNRHVVQKFYDLLESIINKHQISASNIYNVNETGVTTVPTKTSKVLAMRGKKQVGALSSAERGTLVTVETCMSAAGNFMPPMYIFPRKRENPLLMDEAPPGSFAIYHESGWIQKESFLIWFKKFLDFSSPKPDKPVLLLLDGHASHTKSLELINLARERNVILLCFPPHCTHRLQPLDVSLMAPLATFYEQEVRKWLINHPGRCVTIFQVAKLFGTAFQRAAVMQTAINGFQKTGIYPFNRDIFPDYLYAPSETTERPLEHVVSQRDGSVSPSVLPVVVERTINSQQLTIADNETILLPEQQKNLDIPEVSEIIHVDEGIQEVPVVNNEPQQLIPLTTRKVNVIVPPSPSSPKSDVQMPSTSKQSPMSAFTVSPKDIKPVPQEAEREDKSKNIKRRGKTAILTTSPYKTELESAQVSKEKGKKKLFVAPKGRAPKKRKRNDENEDKNNKTQKKKKSKKLTLIDSSSSEEEDEEDQACIFCNELYSRSNEGWIQCINCLRWAHEQCSNADEDDDSFICDFCQ